MEETTTLEDIYIDTTIEVCNEWLALLAPPKQEKEEKKNKNDLLFWALVVGSVSATHKFPPVTHLEPRTIFVNDGFYQLCRVDLLPTPCRSRTPRHHGIAIRDHGRVVGSDSDETNVVIDLGLEGNYHLLTITTSKTNTNTNTRGWWECFDFGKDSTV